MLTSTKRWRYFAAMAVIGDGVMALVYPELDANTWKIGPKPWRNLMQGLHDRPTLTRAIGTAEIIAGIWWALYEQRTG
jgi:drug/metabolite transporter (DMT)-like permease